VHVTSLVTQKGGSGKSTLAASIAVVACERGKRVFVLEIDRQDRSARISFIAGGSLAFVRPVDQ
jgi:chromosome partitioning protein